MAAAVRNPSAGRENWAKDASRTHCRMCFVKFGAFTRRHHCRACGDIFCGNCSSQRVSYTQHMKRDDPDYEERHRRVCKACFKGIVVNVLTELAHVKEADIGKLFRRGKSGAPPQAVATLASRARVPRLAVPGAQRREPSHDASFHERLVKLGADKLFRRYSPRGQVQHKFDPHCADQEKDELQALYAGYFAKLHSAAPADAARSDVPQPREHGEARADPGAPVEKSQPNIAEGATRQREHSEVRGDPGAPVEKDQPDVAERATGEREHGEVQGGPGAPVAKGQPGAPEGAIVQAVEDPSLTQAQRLLIVAKEFLCRPQLRLRLLAQAWSPGER